MTEQRVPLIEEHVRVDKRLVETGVVQIHTWTEEHNAVVSEDLMHEEIEIERVPMNVEVPAVPQIREEGDVIVIPIVEERIVVTKRLVLTQELRVHRKTVHETAEIPVSVRSTQVSVQRRSSSDGERGAHQNSSDED